MIRLPLIAVAVVASLIALSLCAFDKWRAVRGGRRVRERTLLVWSALGGSPGLLVGMVALRHKVRKPAFLVRFFAIVAVQAALAVAWVAWM